jgi:ferredoxin
MTILPPNSARTRRSRRQFIRWAFLTLGATWSGCREQNHTNNTSKPTIPAQGTNSVVRWPDNVAGRLFVTDACIDCDLCKETAPTILARNEKAGHAYVCKQPTSDAELRASLEAMEGCPVEAIIDTAKP